MEKVVFVDRDGVINVDLMGYVEKPEDFRFEEGAIEALKKLHDAGYKMIVISNQAGVGDGVFTRDACWDVHKHMLAELAKEGVEIFSAHYCLHGKNAGCKCRKPEIGLFKEAEKRIQFDKKKTFFIGDKASDIEAGQKYGIKTAFVRTGHGREDEKKLSTDLAPDLRADNLLSAVNQIFDRHHVGPSKRKPRKVKPPRQKKPRVVSAPKTAPSASPVPVQDSRPQPGSAGPETRPAQGQGYSRPPRPFNRRNDFRSRGDRPGYSRPYPRTPRDFSGEKDNFRDNERRPDTRGPRDSFRGRDNYRGQGRRPDQRDSRDSFGGRDQSRGSDRGPSQRDSRGSFRGRDHYRGPGRRHDQRDSRGSFGGGRDRFRGQGRAPDQRDSRDSFRGRDNYRGPDRRPDQRDSRGSFGGGRDQFRGQGRGPGQRDSRGSFRGRDNFRGPDRRPGFSKRDGSGPNASRREGNPSRPRTYGQPRRNTPNRPERNDRRDR